MGRQAGVLALERYLWCASWGSQWSAGHATEQCVPSARRGPILHQVYVILALILISAHASIYRLIIKDMNGSSSNDEINFDALCNICGEVFYFNGHVVEPFVVQAAVDKYA